MSQIFSAVCLSGSVRVSQAWRPHVYWKQGWSGLDFLPSFLTHSRRAVLLILLGHSCWPADLSKLLRLRWCSFVGPSVCKDSGLRCLNITVLLNITDTTSELTPGLRFFLKLPCFNMHMRGPWHLPPLKGEPCSLSSQLILSKPWGSSDRRVWEFPEKAESTDSAIPPCCFSNVQTKNAEGTPRLMDTALVSQQHRGGCTCLGAAKL